MNKTVLITGASAGIGIEFVGVFTKENYDLVITARNETKLNELAAEIKNKHNVKVIVKDLSKQNAAEEVAQIGYNGLMKDKPVIIAGAMNKISAMSSKVAPGKISMIIVNWLQSKK
jgi:short-subunit dehydrogenase